MDSRKYPSLPVLYTRGSHYNVGYNVGANFSQNIKLFLEKSHNIQTKVKSFYDSAKGRELYQTFLKASTDCFPQFVRELRGMSDGSGVPFEQIFLLNMSAEIKNRLHLQTGSHKTESQHKADGSEGCSDIFLNGPDAKLLVHNEDCDQLVKPYGYILNAEIDDVEGKERFMSYCYPGILPGNNFAVNGSGVVITINGQYPEDVVIGAPSRYFLNRSLIRMTDMDHGRQLALNEGYGCSYAFCANIAFLDGNSSMYSMEIGPGYPRSKIHVYEIPEGSREKSSYYFHCNKYKHLDVQEGDFLKSSNARTKRAEEFSDPKVLKDILEILGDTQNPQYPLFRTPRPTDSNETVCTASCDILKKTLSIYYDNPKCAKFPFLTLPLDIRQQF